MSTSPGRRERKKAATRQALADAALRLFLDRGYHDVGVREIAEEADTSVSTLFAHFPGGKEALVFDEEPARSDALVAAVTDRPAGQSIADALHRHLSDVYLQFADHPQMAAFLELVESTPELTAYSRQMWLRHEHSLAHAIAQATGADPDDFDIAAFAHFILEAPTLIRSGRDPQADLDQLFDRLRAGWPMFSDRGSATTRDTD